MAIFQLLNNHLASYLYVCVSLWFILFFWFVYIFCFAFLKSAVESPMNVDEITPLKEEDGSEEKEEKPESEDKEEKPIINQVNKSQIGCLCSVVGNALNFHGCNMS